MRRAMARAPLRSWVALDSAGATTDAYRISGYPQSVVVAPDGRIAGLTNPNDVTGDRLASLLDGAKVEFPYQYFTLTGASANPEWHLETTVGGDSNVVSHAVLQRSPATNTILRYLPTPGRIVGDGVPLHALLRHAYNVPEHAFDNRLPRSVDRYRVSVVAPVPEEADARALLRGLLEHSFSYTARWERRRMDVLVLRRLPGVESEAFQRSDNTVTGMAGRLGFHLSGVPIQFIAESLGRLVFQRPVVDETRLPGRYRIDVDWKLDDPASAIAALLEVGLEVVAERREVQVLIVEPPPLEQAMGKWMHAVVGAEGVWDR